MESFRFSNVRGLCRTMNPDALPPGLVPQIENVELVQGAVGRRRPSLQSVSLTSGPASPNGVVFLFWYTTAAGVDELWAFSGTSNAHRRVSGTWNSVTLTDTPNGSFHAAVLNGKLFIAYDSAVNRLHVYDPDYSTSTVRRVGILEPAAPTVADTGAGAYAATARRYRVSFRYKRSADIITESELSDAVSFTPSGGGTAARITKPATPDTYPTHWVVWGLIGTSGDTYDLYEQLAEIVVGTATYDDSTNPASYSGDAPPQLGLNIPPPSAKYLATDDNRLLMAGAFETTASAGETVPRNSRVWFTRVLGSSDRGDDETIPNTTDQKNWSDAGEKDGDQIVALGGPVNGLVYPLKNRSIYQMTPTSNDLKPYVMDRLTKAVGCDGAANPQYTAIVAEDRIGRPALYFSRRQEIYRLSTYSGVECVSSDVAPATDGSAVSFLASAAVYWPQRRQLFFVGSSGTVIRGASQVAWTYIPRMAFTDDLGVLRGGWVPYAFEFDGGGTGESVATACLFPMNGANTEPVPVIGGYGDSIPPTFIPRIGFFSGTGNTATDSDGLSVGGVVTSAPYALGDVTHRVTCEEPLLMTSCTAGVRPTLSYIRDYGTVTESIAVPVLTTSAAGETRRVTHVEGLVVADAQIVQVKYAWAEGQYSNDADGVGELTGAIVVPYRVQEPA